MFFKFMLHVAARAREVLELGARQQVVHHVPELMQESLEVAVR
jgi:hypothetical protein